MKKVLSLAFLIIFSLFLVACGSTQPKKSYSDLEEVFNGLFDGVDCEHVASNLVFKKEIDGITISYSSSNKEVISNSGLVTMLEEDTDVVVSVVLRYDGLMYEGNYYFTVLGTIGHTHKYGDWEYDEENHFKKCRCGDMIEVSPHEFDEGKKTKDSIIYTCGVCGYQKIELIVADDVKPLEEFLNQMNLNNFVLTEMITANNIIVDQNRFEVANDMIYWVFTDAESDTYEYYIYRSGREITSFVYYDYDENKWKSTTNQGSIEYFANYVNIIYYGLDINPVYFDAVSETVFKAKDEYVNKVAKDCLFDYDGIGEQLEVFSSFILEISYDGLNIKAKSVFSNDKGDYKYDYSIRLELFNQVEITVPTVNP